MITYNHEKFIAEAIEGVLMQETDFPIELIIGEDCSTDGTREICLEYQERHPEIIRVVAREKNIGGSANFVDILRQATGKYTAICEGDDYWIEPDKLQSQIDFLDANPQFSACFHDVEVRYLNRAKQSHRTTTDRDVFDFSDVVAKNFFLPTCSLVFRHCAEDLTHDLILFDWVLQLLLAQRGKLKRLHGVMAIYHQHDGGWTNKNSTRKSLEFVEVTRGCREHFGAAHHDEFDFMLAHHYADICFGYFHDGDIPNFLASYVDIRRYFPLIPARARRMLKLRKILSTFPALAAYYSELTNYIREYQLRRRSGF